MSSTAAAKRTAETPVWTDLKGWTSPLGCRTADASATHAASSAPSAAVTVQSRPSSIRCCHAWSTAEAAGAALACALLRPDQRSKATPSTAGQASLRTPGGGRYSGPSPKCKGLPSGYSASTRPLSPHRPPLPIQRPSRPGPAFGVHREPLLAAREVEVAVRAPVIGAERHDQPPSF